jgi:hypothetical protein
VVLETLSLAPAVFAVTGLLTERECDHILRRAEPQVQPSVVHDASLGAGRTSSDVWLHEPEEPAPQPPPHREPPALPPQDRLIEALRSRTAAVVKSNISCLEGAVQVVRYRRRRTLTLDHLTLTLTLIAASQTWRAV